MVMYDFLYILPTPEIRKFITDYTLRSLLLFLYWLSTCLTKIVTSSLKFNQKSVITMPKTKSSSEGHFFIKESRRGFDLYILDKKKSTLLITAHGAANAAQGHTMPHVVPLLPPRIGVRPKYVPPGMVTQGLDRTRPSIKVPTEHHFAPTAALTYFNDHDTTLASEHDSTLRRILQARAIGLETYMPNRVQTDYDLGDVSLHGQSFAGIKMSRKDFIKAVLLEAEFLREPVIANQILLGMNQANPFGVVVAVPDILMVTGSIALSEVLHDPSIKNYTRVFCSFCRRVHGVTPMIRQHAENKTGIVSEPTQDSVEQRVLKNMREIGYLN
jgi:hypothetical protein